MSKTRLGTVYLVGAGPGDPGLLTLRGAELLRRADVIIHDAILNRDLLDWAPSSARIIAAGRRGTDRVLPQEEVNLLMITEARAGRTVVRLKGGDPFVFGRGGEEAAELAAAGIPFEVVPGVSSFSAVPACAGIPLTHRDHASAFTVVTGHEDPTKGDRRVDWSMVARSHGTKVILMGRERLGIIAAELLDGGLPPGTPAAVIQWGSTPRQKTVVGTLADIDGRATGAGLATPSIVVIGDVVHLRDTLGWFERRPLFGRRVVVTRSREQAGELAPRLTELGAEVIVIPTLRVAGPTQREPMIEALAGLGEYDWIVFSSANGVTAFFDALLAGFEDIRSLGNLRIAAVGPATAARLRQLHLRVDAVPKEYLGRKIAEAIAEKESLENLRILVARAQAANPDLCRELEDRGAIVDDVAFYQSLPEAEAAAEEAARLRDEGADWIIFTSGSTVDHFHARFDLPTLVGRHPGMHLASIGPETTKAIEKLGLTPQVQASPHTLDGLIAGLLGAVCPPGSR